MTNRENYTGFNALQMDGNSETVGSTSVRVYTRDADDKVLLCSGTSVPGADESGYAKGCLFIKTDAGDGTKGLYENQGTNTASDFNLIGDISSAEIGDEAVGIDQIGTQTFSFQGDSVIDLTTLNDTVTLASSGDGSASRGADTVIPVRVYAYVTTAVAADSAEPVVTIQDSSDNSTGLTLTLTDGDAQNDVAFAEIADGTAVTAVDLTSEGLEAKVTTAAADAATATGEAKIIVECLLVK